MPVLLILILGIVMIIFWDYVRENVEVIGTLATSLAFLATAWAAYEARQSAKAAMKATQLTAASLIEMKKNSFKEWFELLLEQHDKMLVDVNQVLKEDEEIKVKLGINTIKGIYYSLTKKAALIKYINHIILTLSYIDKEFYSPSSTTDEKKAHIEQLRNNISSEVNLIIAIFGLNIDNNKTYNAKKLSSLLNKFNFFENELFFSDAISNVHYLETYVTDIFNKEHRENVEFYIDEMVRGYHSEIIPPDIKSSHFYQRTTFAVIWSYDNPCRQYLLERFNNLPQHMRARIGLNMEKSVVKVTEFESNLSFHIGWELKISGKTRRIIKNENEIKKLIKIYFRYSQGQRMNGVVLTNGFYNFFDNEIITALSNYALYKAYSNINSDPRQKEIVDGIVAEVEKIVEIYKSELNKFSFK
ncbi:hypothetical protein H5A35_15340 [Pectobacterium brasiliense]|uniref:hypothetical protein n=1 Tax=Pectobacterium brasiliense TaxID=180957 RepID=UPI0019692FF8|nr:hypothetical protein [Pectobacterium brasiliense]MBN3208775.1 hypothetical protein [Pectobacterium brasiliense]